MRCEKGCSSILYYYDEKENKSKPCDCGKKDALIVRDRIAKSGIPKRYLNCTFESFEIGNNQTLLNAVRTAEKMVKSSKIETGLFITGSVGLGKTMLSCVILLEVAKIYKLNILYVKTNEFFESVKQTYSEKSPDYGSGPEKENLLKEADVLVLDELGLSRNTDWENKKLYSILDSRYERRLPTIITTNLNLEDFQHLEYGRIHSRILEMCRIIKIEGTDYRRKFQK